jgi:hypothetical protein
MARGIDRRGYDSALLNLSDNNQNQAQFNTVVPSQKEMDRVDGFEPTTSALFKDNSIIYLNGHQLWKKKCFAV